MTNCPTCNGPAIKIEDKYQSAFAGELEKNSQFEQKKRYLHEYRAGYEAMKKKALKIAEKHSKKTFWEMKEAG